MQSVLIRNGINALQFMPKELRAATPSPVLRGITTSASRPRRRQNACHDSRSRLRGPRPRAGGASQSARAWFVVGLKGPQIASNVSTRRHASRAWMWLFLSLNPQAPAGRQRPNALCSTATMARTCSSAGPLDRSMTPCNIDRDDCARDKSVRALTRLSEQFGNRSTGTRFVVRSSCKYDLRGW